MRKERSICSQVFGGCSWSLSVCHLLFAKPLHTARRAMASASDAALAGSSSNHFFAFKPNPVPNLVRVLPGLPNILPLMAAEQRKGKTHCNTTNETKRPDEAGPPATPTPPSPYPRQRGPTLPHGLFPLEGNPSPLYTPPWSSLLSISMLPLPGSHDQAAETSRHAMPSGEVHIASHRRTACSPLRAVCR